LILSPVILAIPFLDSFYNGVLQAGDYFILLLLLLVVLMVALLTERVEKVRTLNNLNNELKKEAIKLEDANNELEAFAYSVSHDLRVPLRAIDGFSRIMIEDYEDKLDEEGVRLLNIIRENTKKMGQLIDDKLLLSRAGRQEMTITKIDISSLAKNVYREFNHDTQGRNIDFTVEDMPHTNADRALITQVLTNLIGNAIKFTRGKENAKINIGFKEDNEDNIYYVKDNGAGFDMKYYDKLFGLFQRLHSQEEFEGTGVGLSIVQRIISRHGGRVWGESKVGEGATIYFTIPKNLK
jgi:light-regulated signal transduction histidine kinase (bacteriophytochrome)